MKKQYIAPSIIERECHIQAVLHPVSGARTNASANNDYAGYTGNDIGVNNEKMPSDDTWKDWNDNNFLD